MCKISNSLKLCTCKTDAIEQSNNYWLLYKYSKSDLIIVGEPILPQWFDIGKENDQYNHKKIETMLNTGNCFDINLQIEDNDILELHFNYRQYTNGTTSHLIYEFVYKKDRWLINEFNPFDTNRTLKNKGIISHSFTEQNKL